MEKRNFNRIVDNLDAEIISNSVSYAGIILNLSENGLYMVTATKYNVDEINPTSVLQMRCKLPTGEAVTLDCHVKWFQTKPSPFGVTFSMGMEIKNPPKEYKEFIKTLS